jgi:hypothetical protein
MTELLAILDPGKTRPVGAESGVDYANKVLLFNLRLAGNSRPYL